MTIDSSSTWQTIVLSAVLGTERQPLKLPSIGGALGTLLTQFSAGENEQVLLHAAATTWLYERVGALPATNGQAAPTPALDDARPRCNALAQHCLTRLLGGEYPEVLPEMLAALDAAGQRIPAENLPDLLNLGAKQQQLRAAIVRVIDQRGLWLAAQNPDWSFAAGTRDVAESWQTESSAARRLQFQQLRAEDPGQARKLVESTWDQETPDDRAAFLEEFETGLSPDDEPFLEGALDDRRKEVRGCAADLLARLPESRLCQRMIAHVKPLLTYERSLLSGDKIKVTLPDACDKEMQRDGVGIKPPAGIGEKAWWLMQMLGAVPPQVWTREWKRTPEQIIQAASRNKEFSNNLLRGFCTASECLGEVEWIEALLNFYREQSADIVLVELVSSLPPARQEDSLTQFFKSKQVWLAGTRSIWALLEPCQHPWSREFSRAFLQSIGQHVAADNGRLDAHALSLLKKFALYVSPDLYDEFAEMLALAAARRMNWQGPANEFLTLLQFRRDMLHAIQVP